MENDQGFESKPMRGLKNGSACRCRWKQRDKCGLFDTDMSEDRLELGGSPTHKENVDRINELIKEEAR